MDTNMSHPQTWWLFLCMSPHSVYAALSSAEFQVHLIIHFPQTMLLYMHVLLGWPNVCSGFSIRSYTKHEQTFCNNTWWDLKQAVPLSLVSASGSAIYQMPTEWGNPQKRVRNTIDLQVSAEASQTNKAEPYYWVQAHTARMNTSGDELLGQGIVRLFGKPAGQEDGRLVF